MDERSHLDQDGYAGQLIRFKSRQLCRRSDFSRDEQEEIAQELWMRLLRRMHRYNAARGAVSTFVACVLDREVASFLRYRDAEIRCKRREQVSLNDPVVDESGREVERHQVTPDPGVAGQGSHDRAQDVAEARQWLPSELHQRIVDGLGRGESIHFIAGELGISRRAADRHLGEIREVFEDAGLREYLG